MTPRRNGSDSIVKTIEIVGENYAGNWNRTRVACRAVVERGGMLLLSRAAVTDLWMLPGGGREEGEDDAACCLRETAEETGYLLRLSPCVLEIDEFYEDQRYVSRYFSGTVIGKCERKPTAQELRLGLEPRWLPTADAAALFSRHADYADTDEMKRGLYQREYTALMSLLGGCAPSASAPVR